mmetsp:Transcript_35578/g.83692  ORF Transcript_35578/g.83692 Transcript_35578/m.83692 type:complete len:303 (+) Transcript_35578:495-1403(+)
MGEPSPVGRDERSRVMARGILLVGSQLWAQLECDPAVLALLTFGWVDRSSMSNRIETVTENATAAASSEKIETQSEPKLPLSATMLMEPTVPAESISADAVAAPPSPPTSMAKAPARSVYGPKRPKPQATREARATGQGVLAPRSASWARERKEMERKRIGIHARCRAPMRSLRYPHSTVERTPVSGKSTLPSTALLLASVEARHVASSEGEVFAERQLTSTRKGTVKLKKKDLTARSMKESRHSSRKAMLPSRALSASMRLRGAGVSACLLPAVCFASLLRGLASVWFASARGMALALMKR